MLHDGTPNGTMRGMSVQITIRDVPEDVLDALAARAAYERQSMEDFLRMELERIAGQNSTDLWLRRVRRRKEAFGTRVPPSLILKEQTRSPDRVSKPPPSR